MRLNFLKLASASLVILLSHAVLAAPLNPARCATFGDSVETEQAAGRRAWALKCFPSLRGQILTNNKFTDDNGGIREGYPTLAYVDDAGSTSNPQNWFAPITADAPCSHPEGYSIVAFCGAGCYTPEQSLWFKEGFHAIGEASAQNFQEIMTLSSWEGGKPEFQASAIDYFITDLVDGNHAILNIQMASGGGLRVTENHPLVDGEGRMRAADSLMLGESLVRVDGGPDAIVSIVPEQYYGKVVNLEVKNKNPLEKVIVAQGYLNGTVHYQNQKISDLNRVILRTNLITDEIVR